MSMPSGAWGPSSYRHLPVLTAPAGSPFVLRPRTKRDLPGLSYQLRPKRDDTTSPLTDDRSNRAQTQASLSILAANPRDSRRPQGANRLPDPKRRAGGVDSAPKAQRPDVHLPGKNQWEQSHCRFSAVILSILPGSFELRSQVRFRCHRPSVPVLYAVHAAGDIGPAYGNMAFGEAFEHRVLPGSRTGYGRTAVRFRSGRLRAETANQIERAAKTPATVKLVPKSPRGKNSPSAPGTAA